ncbi:uncharacterized protein LOC126316812 [Schistocerca gregaria]|uniref:uncharacterized protein LOC126316812 n=1 Tax=Schistocerca gregaria TaxID=7010 RepID=UPI00211E2080|nr:uncharacterized protein LOC126316812 [Schistocerca gregaria]
MLCSICSCSKKSKHILLFPRWQNQSRSRWLVEKRHELLSEKCLYSNKSKSADKKFRYPIPWTDPAFYNKNSLERETRRVFDVCNGCRLCYSLCDSFPNLFDLVDGSKTEDVDSLSTTDFSKVVNSCTLCDMCYINKCPYTPPHPLNIDFPKLMLRHKSVETSGKHDVVKLDRFGIDRKLASVQESTGSKFGSDSTHRSATGVSNVDTMSKQSIFTKLMSKNYLHSLYTNMDLMGTIATSSRFMTNLVNWITQTTDPPSFARIILSKFAHIHERAKLPVYVSREETFVRSWKRLNQLPNKKAKAFATKKRITIYATCSVNFNKPHIGEAAHAVLLHNGIEPHVEYNRCCSMPQFEAGKLVRVAQVAIDLAERLCMYIKQGHDIVVLTPSCLLMMKQEWPLLIPNNENIHILSKNCYDLTEYMVKLKKEIGIVPIPELDTTVSLHHACHSRSQNVGFKALELLKMIPKLKIATIERCSGHGGSFGVQKKGFEIANKVGKNVFKQTLENIERCTTDEHFISSECPLSVEHIEQGVTDLAKQAGKILDRAKIQTKHPIEILARAYRLC